MESGSHISCSMLVDVIDSVTCPNLFLCSAVPEWTSLHILEWLKKRDSMGRKFCRHKTSRLQCFSFNFVVTMEEILTSLDESGICGQIPGGSLDFHGFCIGSVTFWDILEKFRGVWSPLTKIHWCRLGEDLGFFVHFICLCWCFNTCNHVIYIHVMCRGVKHNPKFCCCFLGCQYSCTSWCGM